MTPPKPWCICWCGVGVLWHSPVSVCCDSPSLGVCRSETLSVKHGNNESLSVCLPGARHWMLLLSVESLSVCLPGTRHWTLLLSVESLSVCLPGARHWTLLLSIKSLSVCLPGARHWTLLSVESLSVFTRSGTLNVIVKRWKPVCVYQEWDTECYC